MKYVSLFLWIAVFEAISMALGLETRNNIPGWYATLERPPLVPPNYIFPIMWTILYALIAATGWHLWRTRTTTPKILPILFVAYMALNWSWTHVFFGMHLLLAGLIWIAAMNAIAIVFIKLSWKDCPLASKLMIAPTLWTFFAMYLNAGYWYLN